MEDKDAARRMLDEYVKDWQVLIEALPYPVSVHDTDFNIALANKEFVRVCGKTDEVTGLKCYHLVHCADSPVENCPIAKTLKSIKPERSELYEPALKKHLLVQTSPITHKEDLIGVIHSIMDITAIKESEESYKELTDVLGASLNEVKKREETLWKSRDAFLNMLEDISESYKDLRELLIGLVKVMVNALDAKSPWTKGHSERVTQYAMQIAGEIGLSNEEGERLRLSGLLHDIGKIGTYDILLDKPGKLTDEEFELVKKHPRKGAEILSHIKQMNDIIPGVLCHHERYDGKGYPDGLKGEEIPHYARILCVADSFDAMTADRPYRPAPGKEYAISEFRRCSGTHFDPQVVEAFLKVLNKS